MYIIVFKVLKCKHAVHVLINSAGLTFKRMIFENLAASTLSRGQKEEKEQDCSVTNEQEDGGDEDYEQNATDISQCCSGDHL